MRDVYGDVEELETAVKYIEGAGIIFTVIYIRRELESFLIRPMHAMI